MTLQTYVMSYMKVKKGKKKDVCSIFGNSRFFQGSHLPFCKKNT